MNLSASGVVLDDLSPANQQRLAEVLEACLDDMEHGRQPDAEALIARNPELAGAIRTFLGSLDFVYSATALMRDDARLPGHPRLRPHQQLQAITR